MNTAIKRGKGQPDQFVLATEHGVQWAQNNRRTSYLIGGAAILLVILIAVGYSLFQHRTAEAQTAFGDAMQVYQTPLVRTDQPAPPGIKTFATAKERADKANAQFEEVAHRFNMTEPGKLALYFAGLTEEDGGNTSAAEQTLKQVASDWNGDTAALGQLALAQLYGQTGQLDQAVELYNKLAKGHATTVPPGLAQLQLAALYSANGKNEQARQIYAELKDHDKGPQGKPGVAAQVATEKLNPPPAAAPGSAAARQ